MTRYAIYFAPDKTSKLWQLGSSAIGYDAQSGEDMAFPAHPVFAEEAAPGWTEEPRRYGFHATLKAPFSMVETKHEDELLEVARRFAATQMPFDLPKLVIKSLGSFIALVPETPSEELAKLAQACVRDFESFRAPLSEADLARRLQSPLTPRQIDYLRRYGYPYVFEEFRFHMTLSGALGEPERTKFATALGDIFAEIDQPIRFEAIAVYKQPSRAERFRVVERLKLTAS